MRVIYNSLFSSNKSSHPPFPRILKNKQKTVENKAEISLHKLAKSLWDKGKYSEAEQIILEVLNVRRLVGIDKK